VAEGVELSHDVGGASVDIDAHDVEKSRPRAMKGALGSTSSARPRQGWSGLSRRRLAASSAQEPTVVRAQEWIGPRRGACGLSEDVLELGIPLPTPPERLRGPAHGEELGVRHEVRSGRELSHMKADLGDDDLGGTKPDAGTSSRRSSTQTPASPPEYVSDSDSCPDQLIDAWSDRSWP
jgi:hypothetical protein